MKESFHKYFQMGTVHPMSFPDALKDDRSLVESIRRIALDDYFDAVEIPYIENPATRQTVKNLCDEANCRIMIAGQPRLLGAGANLNALEEEKRRQAVDLVKECIDQANVMGADEVGILSGRYEEERLEEYYGRLVSSVNELCLYAKERKVTVLLEVFDYDVDKRSIIGPVGMAKRFAQDMGRVHENFGLLADLSHMPLLRETPYESMAPVKEYIRHLHVGNAVCLEGREAYGDQHPIFGFPGSSVDGAELTRFLQTALELGLIGGENRPILSFEVKPWKDQDAEAVLANCKRTMNLAWANV